jgi:hypothetical protein
MCLFLTLLLVPVAYSKVVQFEESPVGMRAREFARKLAATTLGRWRQTPEPQAVK